MRYHRFPRAQIRDSIPNNRRIAAAKKALEKQRTQAPLFAAEIAAEQPTPERRIEILDANARAWHAERRQCIAGQWRLARRLLRALPDHLAVAIREEWQRKTWLPGSHEYLMNMIRTRLREAWGDATADAWMDSHQ